MGKTRSVANIPSLVTTDLTNNFVGIGSTTPTSKLNVVGITTVGVGKSFRSEMDLTGTVTKAHHINTTDNVNLTSNITANSFFSSTAGSILGCGFTTAAIICDRKTYATDGGSHTPADTWHTRDLNYILQDVDNIVSISGNEFTLQQGLYIIKWSCPEHRTYFMISRLRQNNSGNFSYFQERSSQCYSKGGGHYDQAFTQGQSEILKQVGVCTYTIATRASFSNSSAYSRGLAHDVSGQYNYYTYVTILKGDL